MTAIEPAAMDFAVLDLAQDDDLLEWLYSCMQNREIAWESLFIDTRYHSEWRCGAILIDMRGQAEFQKSMRQRMSRQPIGFLIASRNITLQALAAQLREALFADVAGTNKLFRFYDPRSLSALFTTLDKHQTERLLTGCDTWSWFADGQWRHLDHEVTDIATEGSGPIMLTEHQVEQMRIARQNEVVAMLHQYYRMHLPASDSFAFVDQQVGVASELGLTRQHDYERWIRLAIRAAGPLECSPGWVALHQAGESPHKALDILEVEQGSKLNRDSTTC